MKEKREILRRSMFKDEYDNPVAAAIEEVMTSSPLQSYLHSSRHPRWGEWKLYINEDGDSNIIYVHRDESKKYFVYIQKDSAWISYINPRLKDTYPLSADARKLLLSQLKKDSGKYGSVHIPMQSMISIACGEGAFFPEAKGKKEINGVEFIWCEDHSHTKIWTERHWFYTKSRLIYRSPHYLGEWAKDAVQLLLAEGILLIWPNGKIRFISNKDECVEEIPAPRHKFADYIIFSIDDKNLAVSENDIDKGSCIKRNFLDGSSSEDLKLIFSQGKKYLFFEGELRLTHHIEEDLYLPDGKWLIRKMPGTSRPFA